MLEVDFFPVGDGEGSGDAIAMRFTRRDTGELAHVVVDAGFADDGEALVGHIVDVYGTTHVDAAFSTHPHDDHSGGLPTVLEALDVDVLAVHRPGQHGGGGLGINTDVEELVASAARHGTPALELFAGASLLGGALVVAGPSEPYYEQLIVEQYAEERVAASAGPVRRSRLAETVMLGSQRVVAALPLEVPFGDAGGTTSRNNSSTILDVAVDGERLLLTSDAGGVPPVPWTLLIVERRA